MSVQASRWIVFGGTMMAMFTCTGGPVAVLEANKGEIRAPFVIGTNCIYQQIQTGAADGGRAAYGVTLTNSGDYAVVAWVDAGTNGAAFYFNIDAEPSDPAHLWTIRPTRGFEPVPVTWPADGLLRNHAFTLPAGNHQLVVRGQSPETRLQRLSLFRLVKPPRKLTTAESP